MTAIEHVKTLDWDFQKLFLRSPIGRMVISIEPDGRFFFAEVNYAAASYLDLPRSKIVGAAPVDVMDRSAGKQMIKALRECVKTGKSSVFHAIPRFPGGVKVQVFILNPIMDDRGDVFAIDVMARPDLVDNAQLMRERDDALLMMTSMFDASGLGTMILDHNGRVVRLNDRFVDDFGWGREDLLGEEFLMVVSPSNRDKARRMYQIYLKRGTTRVQEFELMRKDGTIATVQVTTALLELSQGRPFMVATIQDQTERHNLMRFLERAKEDADSASRAKSAFLANMSHELRTPLNAIIGFTELIKDGTFGQIENPKYVEYLGDIHLSARHLLDIINDVLDMSKIEAGKVDLEESDVSVVGLLESVMRIMGDRAHALGIKLDFRVEDDVTHVRADQRLLRQILINLVSNAVKFSRPGGTVLAHAYNIPGEFVRLQVKDEGCGIPKDQLEHVMKPFGQVKNPHNNTGQGTGLGLPIARAMAELHGGHLTISSEEDKGTEVLLDLPAERIVEK